MEFGISKNAGNGLQSWCKVCRTEYSKNHMARVMQLPAKFEVYDKQLSVDEDSKPRDKDLSCVCYNCKTRFKPRLVDVIERVRAINGAIKTSTGGISYAENHLYCSEECKQNCNTYKQRYKYKHQIPLNTKVRCNQHINKKALLDIQIDKYGYTFCEICSEKCKPELHHGLAVAEHANEADNILHQILVCLDCHKKFRNKGGC